MPPYERRIGHRVEVEPLEVRWRVPDDPRRGRRRRGQGPQTGALIDVSVSGLKVRAPAATDLSVGARVPIEIDGVAGTVAVRRIISVPGTRFADYGVQISPGSYRLAAWATAHLSQGAEIDEALWRSLLDHGTS
ncbi:MAG TPA: PilZ domain-containing protein [Iamia sp.]